MHGLSGNDVAGRATATRHGLDDLRLLAVIFDQVADEDDAVVAGVGAQTLEVDPAGLVASK